MDRKGVRDSGNRDKSRHTQETNTEIETCTEDSEHEEGREKDKHGHRKKTDTKRTRDKE